jgi:hypothetical protein
MSVKEELLTILLLKEKTRCRGLYPACETHKAKQLPVYKLLSMTTDGTTTMIGKNNGFFLCAQMMMTFQISFITTALFANKPSAEKF